MTDWRSRRGTKTESWGSAPPWAALAIAGTLPTGLSALQDNEDDDGCYLADDKNPPGKMAFLAGTGRSQEFIDYSDCMGEMAESIEGDEECVIVTQPVWNPRPRSSTFNLKLCVTNPLTEPKEPR